MQAFLIDTDIFSFYLKKYPVVMRQVHAYQRSSGKLNISIISYYELLKGLYFRDATGQMAVLNRLIPYMNIVPLSPVIIRRAARLSATMKQQGTALANMDVLIAATALEYGYPLVTHNQRHFARIPDLALVDWMIP